MRTNKNLKTAMMDPRPVDLTKRLHGSTQALKTMGLKSDSPGLGNSLKGLGKTRLGTIPEAAPHAGSTSMGPFTTSGTLTNPKVASVEDAPGYAVSRSPAVECSTCTHYTERDAGACRKYDFHPRADYTCDSWASTQTAAFIRTKDRPV